MDDNKLYHMEKKMNDEIIEDLKKWGSNSVSSKEAYILGVNITITEYEIIQTDMKEPLKVQLYHLEKKLTDLLLHHLRNIFWK